MKDEREKLTPRKIAGWVMITMGAVIIAAAALWPETADQIASDLFGYGPPFGIVGILLVAAGVGVHGDFDEFR